MPLIISVPGNANNGQSCPRPVELVDLHATLADVCGLPLPQSDGTSLKPLLDNPQAAWDKPAFSQVLRGVQIGTNAPNFDPKNLEKGKKGDGKGKGKGKAGSFLGVSVRTGQFRYTEWDEGRQGATLFDLQNDPQESKDLAKDPAHAETVAKMKAMLAGLKK